MRASCTSDAALTHARIMEAVETLYAGRLTEHVERLGHHAVRGEMWEKALHYLRQAGLKALDRSAYREAVGYYEQAIDALSHLPETRDTREQAIDLRLALRSALLPSNDSARILARLREAEALAVALDDPRRLGQISGFLSVQFRNTGRLRRGHRRRAAGPHARYDRWGRRSPGAGEPLPRRGPLGPGPLSAGDRLSRADRDGPRRGAAVRALRSSESARRAVACFPRLLSCRAGDVRRGPASWARKGCRLPRPWRTPAASCGPTTGSVCSPFARATCPGPWPGSNRPWASVGT